MKSDSWMRRVREDAEKNLKKTETNDAQVSSKNGGLSSLSDEL